jgi:hypothetical protein
MGSATDCPSVELGLCPVADICYALDPERFRPPVLPFRRAQRVQFDTVPAEKIAFGLLYPSLFRRSKMRKLRFSEAGDFRDQKDVDKMVKIAEILMMYGVKTYGYTARTDLDLRRLCEVAYVNVSNDLNSWIGRGANRFKAVPKFSGKALRCLADCNECDMCSRFRGKLIEVEHHGRGKEQTKE